MEINSTYKLIQTDAESPHLPYHSLSWTLSRTGMQDDYSLIHFIHILVFMLSHHIRESRAHLLFILNIN